jgi:UDP-N-acetyl-D-mannosaminuronic acid dehydrogenase
LPDTTIAVIGGGGRVGLSMGLVMTEAGLNVVGIDTNSSLNARIMGGEMPHREEEGQELLDAALSSNRFRMSDDISTVASCDIAVVAIGTPVDSHLNPALEGLDAVVSQLIQYAPDGMLIVLRSTVTPGTTDHVSRALAVSTNSGAGRELQIVYAPERTAEGVMVRELRQLHQLIGAYDEETYLRAHRFFARFSSGGSTRLQPIEAELGKLISNMTRYVNFALANEYHLIGSSYGVNVNKVIDACNRDYPRLNLPSPGPNVGGPCLYKDGWFLNERIPFTDLISVAFRINESMPMHIVDTLRRQGDVKRVAVLGATFKANSDDTRDSLSFKLIRILSREGFEHRLVEPNLDGYDPIESISDCDAVVLMTPHSQFKDFSRISRLAPAQCLYIDIWGFWDQAKYTSVAGVFEHNRESTTDLSAGEAAS